MFLSRWTCRDLGGTGVVFVGEENLVCRISQIDPPAEMFIYSFVKS